MAEGVMVQVLQHYGFDDLPEAFNWRPVRCEFHGDRNASASYMSDGDEREAFSCKACGMKGNPVTLIANVEGISNADAAKRLEEITGQSFTSRGGGGARAHKVVRIGDDAPPRAAAPPPKQRKRRARRRVRV